jgi:hypothetical protein
MILQLKAVVVRPASFILEFATPEVTVAGGAEALLAVAAAAVATQATVYTTVTIEGTSPLAVAVVAAFTVSVKTKPIQHEFHTISSEWRRFTGKQYFLIVVLMPIQNKHCHVFVLDSKLMMGILET